MSTVIFLPLRALAAITVAGALVACSPAPAGPDMSDGGRQPSAGGARLAGIVRFEGSPPPPGTIRFDADPQCAAIAQGQATADDAIRVSDGGGVQSVFVYLKEGVQDSGEAPSTPVVLDQQRCQYVPRVLGIQAGQTLIIRNSDPLLHTVRADARENARFNVATPVQGIEIKRSWNTPEVMVPIGCDMHPWMHAFVGVLPHPYFSVTDAAGRFSLEGVPPGTYTIAAWHERFGTLTQEVVVDARGTGEITFIYSASAAPVPR